MKYEKLFLLFLMLTSLPSCNDEGLTIDGDGLLLTESNGFQIEGTLFLPGDEGPLSNHYYCSLFWYWRTYGLEQFALFLNPEGFAVYTYDKRGIGGSTGNYPIETLENPFDFLEARGEDVLHIIDLLKNHKSVDESRIGLLGSSQGTWVNAMVYEQAEKSIAFMAMTSGGLASTRIENLFDNLTDDPELSIASATERLFEYEGVLGYDPSEVLKDISFPVAFVLGGMDRSHPTLYELELIEQSNNSHFSLLSQCRPRIE